VRCLVIFCLSDYIRFKSRLSYFIFVTYDQFVSIFSVESLIFVLFYFALFCFQNAKLKAKGMITVCMVELVSVFLTWTSVPIAIAQENSVVLVASINLSPHIQSEVAIMK